MPQILVLADPPEEAASTVVYRERVSTTDLESDHFSGQLVERVGWAVLDADQLEHQGGRLISPSSASAFVLDLAGEEHRDGGR